MLLCIVIITCLDDIQILHFPNKKKDDDDEHPIMSCFSKWKVLWTLPVIILSVFLKKQVMFLSTNELIVVYLYMEAGWQCRYNFFIEMLWILMNIMMSMSSMSTTDHDVVGRIILDFFMQGSKNEAMHKKWKRKLF